MQATPAIVVLVRRASEGRVERWASQQIQGIDQALQEDDVPTRIRIGDPGDVEEIQARSADALMDVEGVEQIAQRGHRLRAPGSG